MSSKEQESTRLIAASDYYGYSVRVQPTYSNPRPLSRTGLNSAGRTNVPTDSDSLWFEADLSSELNSSETSSPVSSLSEQSRPLEPPLSSSESSLNSNRRYGSRSTLFIGSMVAAALVTTGIWFVSNHVLTGNSRVTPAQASAQDRATQIAVLAPNPPLAHPEPIQSVLPSEPSNPRPIDGRGPATPTIVEHQTATRSLEPAEPSHAALESPIPVPPKEPDGAGYPRGSELKGLEERQLTTGASGIPPASFGSLSKTEEIHAVEVQRLADTERAKLEDSPVVTPLYAEPPQDVHAGDELAPHVQLSAPPTVSNSELGQPAAEPALAHIESALSGPLELRAPSGVLSDQPVSAARTWETADPGFSRAPAGRLPTEILDPDRLNAAGPVARTESNAGPEPLPVGQAGPSNKVGQPTKTAAAEHGHWAHKRPVVVTGQKTEQPPEKLEVLSSSPEAPSPSLPQLDVSEEEVVGLIRRAQVLLANKDIAGARLPLRRAMQAGSAHATRLLGETYDPKRLSDWNVRGVHGEQSKADELYARAAAKNKR